MTQELFVWTNVCALAAWVSVAILNNVQAWRESASAIERTTCMSQMRDGDHLASKLYSRRVGSRKAAGIALAFVVLFQAASAATLWIAIAIRLGGVDAPALAWANAGLTSTAVFLGAMLVIGNWFAYWIHQSDLQLTHIALLLWVLGLFALVNS